MVASNQLFFSVACTMNDQACVNAMRWFRERIYFSRDYSDIPKQLLDYSDNPGMLNVFFRPCRRLQIMQMPKSR